MPQTEAARRQILLETLLNFPAKLTIRPTADLIMDPLVHLTPVGLKYLTHLLNQEIKTEENVAQKLGIPLNTIKGALAKIYDQIGPLNDDLTKAFSPHKRHDFEQIGQLLIAGGFFEIVEPD